MTCILYKMKMNELFKILIRTWLILLMNRQTLCEDLRNMEREPVSS